MADEINAALDIPYVFEITINDFAALWRKLERRSFSMKARSPNWYGQLQGDFDAAFGSLDASVGHVASVVPQHGMEKTAAEVAMATIAMRRVGIALRELAVEATQAMLGGNRNADSNGRLHYGEGNRITGVDRDYLNHVLDPAEDYEATGCAFEVLGYSLSGPFSMTARIASMILSVHASVPSDVRLIDYNFILKAMNTFMTSANLGYVVAFEARTNRDDVSIFTTNEFNKLTIQSESGDVRLIQKYLKDIGFYFGDVDNRFGPEFEVAVRNFARVYKIYDYAHYSDREFLYTLANAYVRHRSLMSSPAR